MLWVHFQVRELKLIWWLYVTRFTLFSVFLPSGFPFYSPFVSPRACFLFLLYLTRSQEGKKAVICTVCFHQPLLFFFFLSSLFYVPRRFFPSALQGQAHSSILWFLMLKQPWQLLAQEDRFSLCYCDSHVVFKDADSMWSVRTVISGEFGY